MDNTKLYKLPAFKFVNGKHDVYIDYATDFLYMKAKDIGEILNYSAPAVVVNSIYNRIKDEHSEPIIEDCYSFLDIIRICNHSKSPTAETLIRECWQINNLCHMCRLENFKDKIKAIVETKEANASE